MSLAARGAGRRGHGLSSDGWSGDGWSGEAGQAMVELTLILVPLLLLMMGAVDLGLAVHYRNMLSNAAREGARVGIVGTRPPEQICARAMSVLSLPGVAMTAGCVSGDLTVEVQPGTPVRAVPGTVRVTLHYTFRPVTPLVAQATGGAILLEASSTMSLEGAS